eukprot:SAG22_NODE_5835_length_945_cov_1.947991_2_plen_114_part_01
MVSWNILNSAFNIDNLAGQGLAGSLPYTLYKQTEEDKAAGLTGRRGRDAGLTQRDALVLLTLERWLQPGPQQAAVIALQECSESLLAQLQLCPSFYSSWDVVGGPAAGGGKGKG